jgi:hypothetical protein
VISGSRQEINGELRGRHTGFISEGGGLRVVLRREVAPELASYLKPIPRES